MHIILGATGHVGSAVAETLLGSGARVTVVTRDARRAERFERLGAAVAVADVSDSEALRAALTQGEYAFLLLPLADPATDTVVEERRRVANIVRSVAGAGLKKVVVQSTYGAQPGEGLGDLAVLHEFEQAIAALGVRTSAVRAAYYMSNWDSALETARADGVVNTFFPPDFALPMVAPADVGRIAARLLTREVDHAGVHYVEGPALYSAADVARAFAEALGRDVQTVETPRSQWLEALQTFGFSPAAASSYERMMAITLEAAYEPPERPERGQTRLNDYVAALVHGGRETPPTS